MEREGPCGRRPIRFLIPPAVFGLLSFPPMASTRDIRRRIKSVKNTRQITKAMELVAASKMKKAQQAALAGRHYAQLMSEMLAALATRVEESQHPFLAKRVVKIRGIILITSDKGLAGPLNA